MKVTEAKMEKRLKIKTPLTGNFVDISSLKEVTADTRLTVRWLGSRK